MAEWWASLSTRLRWFMVNSFQSGAAKLGIVMEVRDWVNCSRVVRLGSMFSDCGMRYVRMQMKGRQCMEELSRIAKGVLLPDASFLAMTSNVDARVVFTLDAGFIGRSVWRMKAV